MSEGKCSQCGKELVSGEKIRCVYCELQQTQVNVHNSSQASADTNCGKCNLFTIRDKESLHCELCKLWYHNGCNEFALDDRYCSLVYEAPKNIKWFCDKCIWETEKWINEDRSDAKANPKRKKESSNVTRKKAKTKTVKKCIKKNIKSESKKSNESVEDDTELNDSGECDIDINDESSIKDENIDVDDKEDNSKKKKKRLKRNMIIKHKCDQCPKTFCDTQIFIAHTMWHTGDKKPYKCLECGKGFTKIHVLRRHKEMHSIKRKYACEICDKGFNGEDSLKLHLVRKHNKEKPYSCPKCDLKFKLENKYFAKHIRNCEGAESKCSLCDYMPKHRWSMKIHMRTHSDEKLFVCDECGCRLKTAGGLKMHVAAHSSEKPYKCEVCGKGFKQKPNLRTHMAVHDKTKNFFCPVCGTGFASKDRVVNHQKLVHTDEKPFECESCGNKYKTKHNLKLHQRGIRGTCHENDTHKQAIKSQSQRKPKPTSQNIANDSNSSNPVPVNYAQYNQQPPPLMVYTGGNNQTISPVYSRSHVTATIHCPPPALSVFTGHYMGQINNL